MRNDREMMEIILKTAKEDERIRAAYMNGSRTNPNAPKDIFQDYDIVFVVSETASFLKVRTWLRVFGNLIMMQEPDKNDFDRGIDINFNKSYGFLMLFTDGNRIDLRIQVKEEMLKLYGNDKLTVPLLDKDQILPPISPPSDIDYRVQEPTEGEFNSYTNDFLWCLQNVAKGIWRKELPYAKGMFEYATRDSLVKMVNWWIGIDHDFQVSTGKLGKYFQDFLPEPYWKLYIKTYCNGDYSNMWDSLFISCELFRILGEEVARRFNFTYPIDDHRNMIRYLEHIRNLPSDANEIY
ncbi:aminoglycoside 6-adenylyltransferase [Evansella sp. AB-P1]|uniref:aminoglycoside 6-adenylyltransferase n=1 Tax=Evansella sp. AB-P1 TaxID=3037653 RepID=UPI00241E7AFB|nr:aminoglycoside 6-adenylyltransferase [Evansella sp. AB-P1]MDG5788585.1 aminoglycoside 6-adenylyltransferase [Evansella sp. AB-P1]